MSGDGITRPRRLEPPATGLRTWPGRVVATPPGRASPGSGGGGGSRTRTPPARRSATRLSWSESARSRSRRPGRTCGSARTSSATSRPSAPMPPAGDSTCTTRRGASGAIARSSSGCPSSRRRWSRRAKALEADLKLKGLVRERVMACAVRLLDIGTFRVGGEDYADENESYGLATLEKRHVKRQRGAASTSSSSPRAGLSRSQRIEDSLVVPTVLALKRRPGRSPRTHCLPIGPAGGSGKTSPRTRSISGSRTSSGPDYSAKDFRTWNGTVLAAVRLASRERRTRPRQGGGGGDRGGGRRSSATRRRSAARPTSIRAFVSKYKRGRDHRSGAQAAGWSPQRPPTSPIARESSGRW